MNNLNAFIEDNRDKIVSILETIVNIDSATENIDGVNCLGKLLASEFEALGFDIEKYKQTDYGDHIICRLLGQGKNTLIIGHLDTALPAGTAKQTPFRIVDGRGYGPGTADMKSGLVVALYAIKALLDTTSIKPNLTIILNTDEEPGSPTSRVIIEREALRANCAFIMEGSRDNMVVTRRKGVGIFTFKCQGVAAHAGVDPDKGRSAIVELGSLIQDLYALNDADPKEGVTINVGVIKGGTHPYVVAEYAEAIVDCRIPSVEDGHDLLKSFEALRRKTCVNGVSRTWSGTFHRPPMESSEASKRLFNLVQEVGKELGILVKEGYSGGASDGNLTSAMGVPTLCGMGPEGCGEHGPEEYVLLESIFDRTKLFANVLYCLYSKNNK